VRREVGFELLVELDEAVHCYDSACALQEDDPKVCV